MICLNNRRHAIWLPAFCFLLVILVVLPAVVPASESAADQASKVHITAERMVSNTNDQYAEFSGNVQVIQENTVINADVLKIQYKKGADPVSGSGTREDLISRITATGHVRIQVEDRMAYGEKAVYTADDGLLVLTGNKARIESEGNFINGEKIVLNRKTGQIAIHGGAGERVEAVFKSEDGNDNTGRDPRKKAVP